MSRIENSLAGGSRRCVSTLMFCALSALLFAPAAASAQGAKVESTRTAYQAFLMADCPEGSNFCRFVSETVPARGTLEIQRVACQGWHVSTEVPSFTAFAELRTSTDVHVRAIDFLKATYTSSSWGSTWAISEQTLMTIPTGHKLRINLNSGTTSVSAMGCTISGYLTISQ